MGMIIFCCWCALGGAGVLFCFFFTVKLLQFNRDQIEIERLMTGVLNGLAKYRETEVLVILNEMTGPVANILTQGILASVKSGHNPEAIRNAVEKQAEFTELPALEQYMHLLGTMAYLFPWGGVASIFELLPVLAGRDWHPFLMVAAAAVLLAILANAAYNYLLLRMDNILSDMENSAQALLECCCGKGTFESGSCRSSFSFISRCFGHYPEAFPKKAVNGKITNKFFPGRVSVALNISLFVVALALIFIRDLDFVKSAVSKIKVPEVRTAATELIDRKKMLIIQADGQCFCDSWTPRTLDEAIDYLMKNQKNPDKEIFVWAASEVKAETLAKIFEKFKNVFFIVDNETPAHEIQVK